MPRADVSRETRRAVANRANDCCEYCLSQLRYSSAPFSVEHINPRSSGGTDEPANLALACQGCNSRKYTATSAIDPATGVTVPLYHPRHDEWDEHFVWSADFTEVIGVSRIGRATAVRLGLNRPGIVNLRQVLVALDLHPPRAS